MSAQLIKEHRELPDVQLLNCSRNLCPPSYIIVLSDMREKKSMAISSWFCSNNTRNMFVKIVHPGGHVELHDRPITAADIVSRNPKCCVAYPNVFKQPWAIVAPETILMPGQKFYVVPLSTVRKLQLHAKKYFPYLLQEMETIQNAQNNRESHGRGIVGEGRKEGDQLQLKDSASCCTCLRKGMKIKARSEDKSKEITSSNSSGSSEKNSLKKKPHIMDLGGSVNSPKRLSSFDQWQPSLQSISEEYEQSN